MWTDNETTRDYLNFGIVSRTVAEIIEQAQSRPISIGVSGAWGVGKSSMIKLIKNELSHNEKNEKFIFVEFNAWLYQGYDDARAALIDVVASKLAEEAKKREGFTEKILNLFKGVKWFRLMTATALSLASTTSYPLGKIANSAFGLISGNEDEDTDFDPEKAEEEIKKYINPNESTSPPKQIEALRKSFEDVLEEMEVTLVVLIDDLDRCLPETTISTLEAIRLLLFLEHTAFVIAADDQMIKHAVKKHFQGIEDNLVINYFDKLIQVPIRVPPLGTQEVRAYMMMLFIDNSSLPQGHKDHLQQKICEQLGKAWQGHRVDLNFVKQQTANLPSDLESKLALADRLAVLMTQAVGISGNPRLIKRFMNALSIRLAMAKAQGISVDEGALVKILLFERCGNPKAFSDLIRSVTESMDGQPRILVEWENHAVAGKNINLKDSWDDDFVRGWLRLQPPLAQMDLRGVLYVSREHIPLITPEDRLSPEAANLLEALLNQPSMAASLINSLKQLSRIELTTLMDKVLARAQQQQEWGVPDILEAALAVVKADSTQGEKIATFLRDRPSIQIKASIIPKISDQVWANKVFDQWLEDDDVIPPVKKTIRNRREKEGSPR